MMLMRSPVKFSDIAGMRDTGQFAVSKKSRRYLRSYHSDLNEDFICDGVAQKGGGACAQAIGARLKYDN
jgi:hypothetical protein